jgi:hypothetical protein
VLPVRTDHLADDSGLSFQAMIAERLRQAPWFVVSAAAHALVLLLLWLLIPPETRKRDVHHVAMTDTATEDVAPPPEVIQPETKPEEIEEPVVVEPVPVETPVEHASDADSPHDAMTESAFASFGTNPTVGVGGNAGGPYGQRGGRKGTRGNARPPGPAAVEEALRWLGAHQDADGKWDCDDFMKHDDATRPICTGAGSAMHDVGVTGLALLAFLGDGSTLRSGPWRDNVRRAVQWLRSQQAENGLFGAPTSSDFVYDHAIATYAICEAYGLSESQLLRPTAQRALNYLEAHRNPYGVWRYQPRDGDGDTSVTGWCIMAYAAGKHFGLQVNDSALQLAAAWLDQVSDASGHHGYCKQGQPSSRKPGDHATRFPVDKGAAMTAVGLFCRYFLGQKPTEKPVMTAAANLLVQKPPVWDEKTGSVDHYYWYYATYALFQAGGPAWRTWQRQLEPALVENQHRDAGNPNLRGSWDPVCAWGEDGGRVYSTAILALTLQANWRYTRLLH